MNKLFVRPFEFYDFFEKDWDDWKDSLFEEAKNYDDDTAGAALQPYGGEISGRPILYDEDDIRYLWQFHPKDWVNALKYRYDDAMEEIKAHREKYDKEKTGILPEHDWVSKIPIGVQRGAKVYVGPGGGKIYLGATTLAKKLENPQKYHSLHTGSRIKEGPGIGDVDPFQKDPSHPEHPSNYTHGLYDMDITRGGRGKYKPISKETAALVINSAIKASGLGLFGKAPGQIKDPYTGQMLDVNHLSPQDLKRINGHWHGWVGNVTAKGEEDPAHAHHEISHVNNDGTKEIIKSRPVPLSVPSIKRKIYYVQKGKLHSPVVSMPILGTGRLIPSVNLTPEQRLVLMKRRGQDPEDIDEFSQRFIGAYTSQEKLERWKDLLADKDWKIRAKALQMSRPGNLHQLFSNWDILSSEQKAFLTDPENHRNLMHLAKWDQKENPAYLPASERENAKEYSDKWSNPQENLTLFGHNPQKGMRKTSHIPKETAQQIWRKYGEILDDDIWEGANDFLKLAGDRDAINKLHLQNKREKYKDFDKVPQRHPKKLHQNYLMSIDQLLIPSEGDSALFDIIKYLIALRLNDPKYGIYDKELGLTAPTPKATPTRNQKERADLAYKILDDFAKIIEKENAIVLQMSVGKEGEFLEPGGSTTSAISGGGEEGPGRGKRTIFKQPEGKLARIGWNVPLRFGDTMKELFAGVEDDILEYFGPEAARKIDKLKKQMSSDEAEVMQRLYEKAIQQLKDQGITGRKELKEKADAYVKQNLESELEKERAKKTAEEEAEEREKEQAAKEIGVKEEEPENFATHYRLMKNFIDNLIKTGSEMLPIYNDKKGIYETGEEGRLFNLSQLPPNANNIVYILKNVLFADPISKKTIDKGVEEFAVPLYMAAKKAHNQLITPQQAFEDIKAQGITPKGTPPVARPEQEPRPLPAAAKPLGRSIEDLLAKPEENLEELVARKDELLQDRNKLQSAVNALYTKIKAKKQTGQRPSKEEAEAVMKLDMLLKKSKPLGRSIEDLLAKPEENLEELAARKDELLQDRNKLQSAVNALYTKIKTKKQMGQRPSREEANAYITLDSILKGIK